MTLALFDFEPTQIDAPYPGRCLCGGVLPVRARYEREAQHCSYWCSLVERGPAFYTLETIALWLKGNRPTSDAARAGKSHSNQTTGGER